MNKLENAIVNKIKTIAKAASETDHCQFIITKHILAIYIKTILTTLDEAMLTYNVNYSFTYSSEHNIVEIDFRRENKYE